MSHTRHRPTLPSLSRPARPDRCHACDLEMGTTSSDSSPVAACVTRSFTMPVSTTYFTPWMVTDDSAMFVDRITFRLCGGAGANTASCCSGGSAAYSGKIYVRAEDEAHQQRGGVLRQQRQALLQQLRQRLDLLLPRQEHQDVPARHVQVQLRLASPASPAWSTVSSAASR